MGKYAARPEASNEWYTPAGVLACARKAMGGDFDLDPASCTRANKLVRAERFLTFEDDGLTHSWASKRLWLNPPYSRGSDLPQWVDKLVLACESGVVEQACLLLHAATDTWYGQRGLKACQAACLTEGRLKFYGPRADGKGTGGMQIGQMILYFGHRTPAFADAFSNVGAVLYR